MMAFHTAAQMDAAMEQAKHDAAVGKGAGEAYSEASNGTYGSGLSSDEAAGRLGLTSGPGVVGAFAQDHAPLVCGGGGPQCASRPYGSSPMDKLAAEFLERTSPAVELGGQTIAESILAVSSPEHAAHIIETASGSYRLDFTVVSEGDWSIVEVASPRLSAGERWVGTIHTHPGSRRSTVVQSVLDGTTARSFARLSGGTFNHSYVIGPSGKGPYFGIIVFSPTPRQGVLTAVGFTP
jgi:hypothetical protein